MFAAGKRGTAGGIVTLANIAIYAALIIFVIARRMIGRPVGAAKQLFALPVIIVVIGWGDATKGLGKPAAVTVTVAGCAIALLFGLLRGRADRISTREGASYVQWTWLSLGLFAGNLLVKLCLDLAGVAAGETFADAGHSLILSLGLTLLGEAVVIWYRSGGAAQLAASNSSDAARLSISADNWGPSRPGDADHQGASHSHHADRHHRNRNR
jgi:hypothetical protein